MMRILVVSDTHRHVSEFLIKLNDIKKPDIFVFLGDNVDDGERIAAKLQVPSYIIAGNGDWGTFYPQELVIEAAGRKILLTHGHKFNVKYDLNRLYYHAVEQGVDIVLFGHTHVPMRRIGEELLMMNPGSPSLPRGGLTRGSYGELELNDKVIPKIFFMR